MIKEKCSKICCLPYQIYLIHQIWWNWFDCVLAAICQWLIGLNNCVTLVFLLKTVLVNLFFKTCISVNLFVFFALYPVIFWKNQCFFVFLVITRFTLLTLIFTHCYVLSTRFFYNLIKCSPVITRTSKETKTRWSLGEILSSVSPFLVCYK